MIMRLQLLGIVVVFCNFWCQSQSTDSTIFDNRGIFIQEFLHPSDSEDSIIQVDPFEPTENDLNPIDSKVTEIQTCVCGSQPGSLSWLPFIQGGIETKVNEFPWVVALIHRSEFQNGTVVKRHYCGGSLINNRFVLTAQHCLLGMQVNFTEVWFNEHDLLLSTETVGGTVKRQASRFIPHPNYHKFMYYNDLALIELDEEVDITDGRLRSICLPKSSEIDEEPREAVTAGWGRIGFKGPKSDKLLKVDLPIIPNSKCVNVSGSYYKRRVTEHTICAGDLYHGKKDSCPGDSGGGLFVRKSTGNYELIGICSFGLRCGEVGKPGVYTKVSKYINWIEFESRTGRQCRS